MERILSAAKSPATGIRFLRLSRQTYLLMGGTMNRVFLCLSSMLIIACSASAQWDRFVPLTSDTITRTFAHPEALVDSNFVLHVFAVQQAFPYSGNDGTFYFRFDSWGNPIGNPVQMAPDTVQTEYPAAAILDHSGNIQVIWGRQYNSLSNPNVLMYAKINLSGQIIAGPSRIDQGPFPHYTNDSRWQGMVETTDGVIWYTDGSRVYAFDENMNVVCPFRAIAPSPSYATAAVLAVSPNNQVWAHFRYGAAGRFEDMMVCRIDTLNAPIELLLSGNSPNRRQVGNRSFFIDNGGVFHHVLWREDLGDFYCRDPRTGQPFDTLNLCSNAEGAATKLLSIGTDTLALIQQSYNPTNRLIHYSFDHSGHRLGEVMEIPVSNGLFQLDDCSSYIWRRGSRWVTGTRVAPNHSLQLTLIHVPGPNEPPNAVYDHPPAIPSSDFILYPNPTNGGLFVQGLVGSVKAMSVFNVLGQQVLSLPVPRGSNGIFSLPQIDALSTGEYFLKLQTRDGETDRKFVVAR